MPQHDGYWFVGSLRALPPDRGGALPVVAITAHGATHGPDRTLPAGFQAHLRKPVDPWELCRVVAAMTRKRAEPIPPCSWLPRGVGGPASSSLVAASHLDPSHRRGVLTARSRSRAQALVQD